MKALFDKASIQCSRLTTRTYSTSFSLGIMCLHKDLRNPVFSVYGFVRFADEIVDSFHQYNRRALLEKFRRDTWEALDERISLNPILNSFQETARHYQIDRDLIEVFLKSMEMDLDRSHHDEPSFKQYVTGSAEAVGLMCLRIFSRGHSDLYEQLKPYAMALGSAFQKVNFLRDLRADQIEMGRTYFPSMEKHGLTAANKKAIEEDLKKEFEDGLHGIKKLPRAARFGVYIAYMYYLALYRKIRNTPAEKVLSSRIRISNRYKAALLASSFVKHQLNMI